MAQLIMKILKSFSYIGDYIYSDHGITRKKALKKVILIIWVTTV
jgi:hypothetical protein